MSLLQDMVIYFNSTRCTHRSIAVMSEGCSACGIPLPLSPPPTLPLPSPHQDIVAYLKSTKATHRSAVKAAILQAPTSDRECMEQQAREGAKGADEAFEEMKRAAQAMIAGGRGVEMMPRSADPLAPITAYRFHSLACTGGDDDMFSSDFSDKELKERVGHMGAWPSMVR
ncbi:unnamed protein product [Closterium sp. NIES-54]